MTTTAATLAGPIASDGLPGTWQGNVMVTRAASERGEERVFVADGDGRILLILTPTEASDLAEVMHAVSGMATSTRGAEFLAQVHRDNFARYGVSKARAAREAGIPRRRLNDLLAGRVSMTDVEHKALSRVGRERENMHA